MDQWHPAFYKVTMEAEVVVFTIRGEGDLWGLSLRCPRTRSGKGVGGWFH